MEDKMAAEAFGALGIMGELAPLTPKLMMKILPTIQEEND